MQIVVFNDGSCSKDSKFAYHKRETINKMACYFSDSTWDFGSEFYKETDKQAIPPGAKLFVAGECKTGRDAFRNSGYSITRDKVNAQAILVPDVHLSDYTRFDCNIVAKSEDDDLYLVTVRRPGYGCSNITAETLAYAKTYLKTTFGLESDDTELTELKVWFLPKCEEWEEVMKKTNRLVPYIQESLVDINPSTTISPETLVFWENIDDKNLLARTICTSDWMKYPVTVSTLLSGFKDGVNWYTVGGSDFRRLLKSIKYEAYCGRDEFLKETTSITPEDYEMLQSYIFYKLGVSEAGGMVTASKWDTIPLCVKNIIQRRICLKPLEMPGRTDIRTLRNIVNY